MYPPTLLAVNAFVVSETLNVWRIGARYLHHQLFHSVSAELAFRLSQRTWPRKHSIPYAKIRCWMLVPHDSSRKIHDDLFRRQYLFGSIEDQDSAAQGPHRHYWPWLRWASA